jgi:hypothetical protein
MDVSPKDVCIFIASHMSKSTRILYLLECLDSLIHQRVEIPIYLSISFETPDIQLECMNQLDAVLTNSHCEFLNIIVRPQKTPQMQHLYLLHQEVGQKHRWIMFCDDDDTYTNDRTHSILTAISTGLANIEDDQLAGVYEASLAKIMRHNDTNIGVIVSMCVYCRASSRRLPRTRRS